MNCLSTDPYVALGGVIIELAKCLDVLCLTEWAS